MSDPSTGLALAVCLHPPAVVVVVATPGTGKNSSLELKKIQIWETETGTKAGEKNSLCVKSQNSNEIWC